MPSPRGSGLDVQVLQVSHPPTKPISKILSSSPQKSPLPPPQRPSGDRDGAAQTATYKELNSLLGLSQSQFFPFSSLGSLMPPMSSNLSISKSLHTTPTGLDPMFSPFLATLLCPHPPKSQTSFLQLNNSSTLLLPAFSPPTLGRSTSAHSSKRRQKSPERKD